MVKKTTQVQEYKIAKISKKSALALMAISSMTLSGCAVMGNDFDCQKVGGLQGCVSLDQVYQMSNQGKLPDQDNSANLNAQNTANQTIHQQVSAPSKQALSGYSNAIPNVGQPVRFGDKIQQVTLFPYQDSAGNYHEASIVYAVLKKSHWINYPVSQVQTDDSEV